MQRQDAERYEGPVLNVAWGKPQEILGIFGWVKSRGPHPVDMRFRGRGYFCSQLYIYIYIYIYVYIIHLAIS